MMLALLTREQVPSVLHVLLCVCVCVCVCVCMCICIRAYCRYTYVYSHTHTDRQTHTHTHTHMIHTRSRSGCRTWRPAWHFGRRSSRSKTPRHTHSQKSSFRHKHVFKVFILPEGALGQKRDCVQTLSGEKGRESGRDGGTLQTQLAPDPLDGGGTGFLPPRGLGTIKLPGVGSLWNPFPTSKTLCHMWVKLPTPGNVYNYIHTFSKVL